MVESANQSRQIFISYSRKDREWLDRLKGMLTPILKQEQLDLWDDSRIAAGKNWKREIKQALESAQVAVLLVTSHFLASEFINAEELPPILDASRRRGLKVIWVYVSPCLYQHTEIAKYQAAHDPETPLARYSKEEQDQLLVDICEEIIKASRQYAEVTPDVEQVIEERLKAQQMSWDLERKTLVEGFDAQRNLWQGEKRHLIQENQQLSANNEQLQDQMRQLQQGQRRAQVREQRLQAQLQQLTTERDQVQAQVQDLQQGLRSQVAPQPIPEGPQEEDLRSEKGIDYTKLRDLLRAGQWKEADQETARVMLAAAGTRNPYLTESDVDTFPCSDLRTIDQLWRAHSQDRFGFSIQKQILIKMGGTPGQDYDQEIWRKFGDQVGWLANQKWINNSDLDLSLAPEGHLPFWCLVLVSGSMQGELGVFFLASRLVKCSRS